MTSEVLRVLVVDDELLIRWSLAETLTESGHLVSEAADGAHAIRAVEDGTQPFDVVLLDYRLPDSDSLTLLARIRKAAPEAQVILMTAYGTPEVIKGALDLGAYRVLSKPIDMPHLEPLVREAHQARPS
jgi:DNA-binding NtrC family response regulator